MPHFPLSLRVELGRVSLLLLILILPFYLGGKLLAQEPVTAPILVLGDEMHWIKKDEILEARGHVKVDYEEGWFKADFARVNYRTGVVEALGEVSWYTPQVQGHAQALTMNTRTLTGELWQGILEDPLGARLEAERILRTGKNRFRVFNGRFTTCRCPDQRMPAWEITWVRSDVRWRDDFTFLHGVFWANGIPILYLPAGYSSFLGKRTSGFLFPRIGYASRYGFLLEPGFFYAMGDHADLTMRWLFAELSGYGFSTQINAISYTGSLYLETRFFQESSQAPYLKIEKRNPRQRWSISGRVVEQPYSLLRLNMNSTILSDQLQQRDFARNLGELTQSSTSSDLILSGERKALGSFLLRLSISQALLSTTSSGSRFPTLWLRLDPARFDPLPLYVGGDLRLDQFFSFTSGSKLPPWQPQGYRREGRRLLTHLYGGGALDPLPGLRSEVRLGIVQSQRDRGLGVPVSGTTLPYTENDNFLRLSFHHRWISTHLEPGVFFFYTPGQTPSTQNPIEDRDRIAFSRWLVPYIRWVSLGKHGFLWEAKIYSPLSVTNVPPNLRLPYLRNNLWLSGQFTLVNYLKLSYLAYLRNFDDIPRFSGGLQGNWGRWTAQVGYFRITTQAVGRVSSTEPGRPSPFADDPFVLTSTHEIVSSLGYHIGRFSGVVSLRRRLLLPENRLLGWVERGIRIRYTSPCQCWYAELNAQDFPGAIADRVEFLIELARLGGVGVQPLQPQP